MIGAICLGLGIGIFFGSWFGYEKHQDQEEFFHQVGNFGFFLGLLGLIMLIYGG